MTMLTLRASTRHGDCQKIPRKLSAYRVFSPVAEGKDIALGRLICPGRVKVENFFVYKLGSIEEGLCNESEWSRHTKLQITLH